MKFEDYERPAVAVDLVLFRMKNGKNGKKKREKTRKIVEDVLT